MLCPTKIQAAMVSTKEEITDDSPSFPMIQTIVKKQVLGNHCVYSPTCFMA